MGTAARNDGEGGGITDVIAKVGGQSGDIEVARGGGDENNGGEGGGGLGPEGGGDGRSSMKFNASDDGAVAAGERRGCCERVGERVGEHADEWVDECAKKGAYVKVAAASNSCKGDGSDRGGAQVVAVTKTASRVAVAKDAVMRVTLARFEVARASAAVIVVAVVVEAASVEVARAAR